MDLAKVMFTQDDSLINLSSSCLSSKENFDRIYSSLRFLISVGFLDVIIMFLQIKMNIKQRK